MRRKIPEWQDEFQPQWPSLYKEVREYELLTPLFGGGAQPQEPDPVTVVRASGIKGQLRFWWRAIRGWKAEGDLQKLRELEEKYFGSVGEDGRPGPSPVVLRVIPRSKPERREAWSIRTKPTEVAPGYLSFPLQPQSGDIPSGRLTLNVKFALEIQLRPPKGLSLEDLKREVDAALWAWESFGGVGARTRRGFGALRKIDRSSLPPATAKEWETNIKARLEKEIEGTKWPSGVPHLRRDSLVAVVPRPWKHVAGQYQRFRQDRGTSRQGQPGRGKSRWPESDTIRKLGRGDIPTGKFPRGQLGLPIIFHFKDEEEYNSTLRPKSKDYDRLASPLIFRPLSENMTLVTVLDGCRDVPEGVLLEFTEEPLKGRTKDVQVHLEPHEAAKINMLQGQTDVVRAAFHVLTRSNPKDHPGPDRSSGPGKGGHRR